MNRTGTQRRRHPSELYGTAPNVALDCRGSAGCPRGNCILDCVSVHEAGGIETAGAAGGRPGPRRVLKRAGGMDPTLFFRRTATRIAYLSRNHLYTRKLDQAAATDLPLTTGATSPFFSPDGQWIGFVAGGKLRKISVEGGAEIVLCDAASSYTGADWGEDGNIIASLRVSGGLYEFPLPAALPLRSPSLRGKKGRIGGRRFCQEAKRSSSPSKIPLSVLMTQKLP